MESLPITVKIFNAVVEDAPGIALVHVNTWHSTYTGLIPQKILDSLSIPKRTERWRSSIENDLSPIGNFVAKGPDGRVLGFAVCGPSRDPEMTDYKGELWALYVLQEHQGLGIGRRLFERVAKHLKDENLLPFYVWVLATNPSRKFYEAMGGHSLGNKIKNIMGTDMLEAGCAFLST